MVDWEKNRTFAEKFVIDFAYKKNWKLVNKIASKLIKTRLRNVEDYGFKDLTVYCVGNSHLDSAWLWRKSDSREKKIFATFSRNVFHLTKEPFPKYTFTANATVHYEWIKEDFPKLFEKIKNLVDLEKWEYVGGEYVETDCNIPNGESLIMQRLIGQRFYIKEFGAPASVAWMDDVFGWPNSIPQIFLKSGSKYFYTNKFCYSEYSIQYDEDSPNYAGKEKFPFFHYLWESPDGSRVLCTWAQHKNNFHKHLQPFTKHSRTVKNENDRKFDYTLHWNEIDEKCSDEIIPLIVNAYGKGDGGMGPDSFEIMEKMIWEDQNPFGPIIFKNSRIIDAMKVLERYRDRLPIWNDEMYLEGHRGVLTSISMIKENNHTAEVLLNFAESLSVFSGLLGAEHFRKELLEDWKIMLFLQFHDVLPGSSIAEVYRDAADDYSSIIAHLFSVAEAGLTNVAHLLKEEIKKDIITLYNTLGWQRENGGYLTIQRRNFTTVLDSKSAPLHAQKVAFSPYITNREIHLGSKIVPGKEYIRESSGLDKLHMYETQAQDKLLIHIPPDLELGSFGIQNLYLISRGQVNPSGVKSKLVELEDYFTFHNAYYFVKISKQNGRIMHVSSDEKETNALGEKGIGHSLYEDEKTRFDAWNIDLDFKSKEVEFPEVDSIKIIEQGPLRHSLLIKHKVTKAKSTIHTLLSFYEYDPKIYGETLIDWQEDHKILKLTVDTKFDSAEILCGNPYGIQKRSTKPETVYQKAMIEYAFQQFASWSAKEALFGKFKTVNFYSQSKYGMSAEGGTAEFSMLKAAYFEKPNMQYATLDDDYDTRSKIIDVGFHRIPWAVEFLDEKKDLIYTIKSAYEYNYPMIAAPTGVSHPEISFLSIDKPNVLILALKEMEKWMRDAPDWFYKPQMSEIPFVVRIVEHEGKETKCKMTIDKLLDIKKAFEVDLLERIKNNNIENSDLEYKDHVATFTVKPYEIKTLLLVGRIPLED